MYKVGDIVRRAGKYSAFSGQDLVVLRCINHTLGPVLELLMPNGSIYRYHENDVVLFKSFSKIKMRRKTCKL